MFLAKMRTFNPFKRSKFMLFFQFGDSTLPIQKIRREQKRRQEKRRQDKRRQNKRRRDRTMDNEWTMDNIPGQGQAPTGVFVHAHAIKNAFPTKNA